MDQSCKKKKSQVLKRNFTVNTFCEKRLCSGFCRRVFANHTKHIWTTKLVNICNQHDKNNISFGLRLALLPDIKVQLQINRARQVTEMQMNKCLSLPAGLFFRCLPHSFEKWIPTILLNITTARKRFSCL